MTLRSAVFADRLSVAAIIVCFQPDVGKVNQLAAMLLGDGVCVILADNSKPVCVTKLACASDCVIVAMDGNRGIAAAQNAGIRAAREEGADVVLFFDQDTIIDADFVRLLLAAARRGEAHAFAPRGIDDQTGDELEAIRVGRAGLAQTITAGEGTALVPADVVISSGMAITIAALDLVGDMNSGLFIDLVDTEWCLRSRAAGVPLHIVPGAVMKHRIGSHTVRRLGVTVVFHSPRRCYYQLRNPFLLLRMRHVPLLFALKEIASILVSRLVLLTLVSNRAEYLRHYGRGVADGLLGRSGPYPG